jgi:hypothetical protein
VPISSLHAAQQHVHSCSCAHTRFLSLSLARTHTHTEGHYADASGNSSMTVGVDQQARTDPDFVWLEKLWLHIRYWWDLVIAHGFGAALLEHGGSYFLIYVIQAALLNSSGAILLFQHHFCTAVCGLCCRGKCCRSCSQPVWVFPIEYHVAVAVVIFAAVLMYSVAAPLILPAGLLYFALKYWSDKYVLLFGHDGDLADTDRGGIEMFHAADAFLLFIVLLYQLATLHLLHEKSAPLGCFVVLGICVSMSIYSIRCSASVPCLSLARALCCADQRPARTRRSKTRNADKRSEWARQALPPSLHALRPAKAKERLRLPYYTPPS